MDEHLTTEQAKLFERIEKLTRNELNPEVPIPGLRVYRKIEPTGPTRYSHQPSVCLIAQGAKEIVLGDEALYYDQNHFLVTSVDLPIVAQVPQATPDKPYLGLAFRLDQREIAQVLADGHLAATSGTQSNLAMTVGELTTPLVSAFVRLLDLLDEPQAIPFLAPALSREILYRLLTSETGHHLRQVGLMGSQNSQILRAVEWLKTHFDQPMLVESLADYCQMSASAFHHHFRRVTAMSPLQYQKWLRLQEARRLMLTSDIDVTRAAFRVGYESSSQFSREYGRMFGSAPAKDIKTLRVDPTQRQAVAV